MNKNVHYMHELGAVAACILTSVNARAQNTIAENTFNFELAVRVAECPDVGHSTMCLFAKSINKTLGKFYFIFLLPSNFFYCGSTLLGTIYAILTHYLMCFRYLVNLFHFIEFLGIIQI